MIGPKYWRRVREEIEAEGRDALGTAVLPSPQMEGKPKWTCPDCGYTTWWRPPVPHDTHRGMDADKRRHPHECTESGWAPRPVTGRELLPPVKRSGRL